MKKYRLLYILTLLLTVTIHVAAQEDRQFIREGNRLYRQQNYVKAETEYRKALAKNSRNTQAMYNLGCALMMQKKDSLGIKWLEQAAQEEKTPLRRAKAYHNMGVICQGHQLFSEAIEAYKSSLRLNPSDDETRYNLVLCKRQLKNNPNQNKQNKNDNNKNNKNNKDKDKQKQQQQQDKDKNKQDKEDQKQQPPKEQMSKDNAEQLLNAAMQEEKSTQQRLKKAMQQPRAKTLEKNW